MFSVSLPCIIQNTMENNDFRLIKSPPASGAWNMALDEALLNNVAEKKSLPTLRFYSWEPACLSLGYAQPVQEIDQERLEQKGWDLVRRPTGGRAILHIDELTYSITAPLDHSLVEGGVLESYRRISTALSRSLLLLGANVNADKEYGNLSNAEKSKAVCFEVPSNYEITSGGKKLIGSAQARRYGGVLQHGSLPLFGSITRIAEVLFFSTEEERRLTCSRILAHATTLSEVLNRMVTYPEASEAITWGFEEEFGIRFIHEEPTKAEESLAHQLLEEKYSHIHWNQKN